jgi:hypothetical protein
VTTGADGAPAGRLSTSTTPPGLVDEREHTPVEAALPAGTGGGRPLRLGHEVAAVAEAANLPRMDYRVGDVLHISCPFTATVVSGVDRTHVFVRWPWWRIDPDADGIRWNGDVALARDDPDELYATDPPARRIAPGDSCRVGIPPRVVHVAEIYEHDPPQETGWLPRPTRELLIMPIDTTIDPDDDIPFVLELVFRPYAFLRLGDDVADADGRAWRFDGPWTWFAYDGVDGVPAWPLTLLAGDTAAEAVSAATASGSHESETTRWHEARRG